MSNTPHLQPTQETHDESSSEHEIDFGEDPIEKIKQWNQRKGFE